MSGIQRNVEQDSLSDRWTMRLVKSETGEQGKNAEQGCKTEMVVTRLVKSEPGKQGIIRNRTAKQTK